MEIFLGMLFFYMKVLPAVFEISNQVEWIFDSFDFALSHIDECHIKG